MLARERKLTALHSLPRESHVRVGGRRRGPAARDRRLLTGASAQGRRWPCGPRRLSLPAAAEPPALPTRPMDPALFQAPASRL